MEDNEFKKLLKKALIIGSFFAVAGLFYWLEWRGALVFYALMVAVVLVLVILLQSGKGGGLASLGGMSGESFLGTQSATPISKATYVIGFLLLFIGMLVARLGMLSTEGMERPERSDQPVLGSGGGMGGSPLFPGRQEDRTEQEDGDQEGESSEQ